MIYELRPDVLKNYEAAFKLIRRMSCDAVSEKLMKGEFKCAIFSIAPYAPSRTLIKQGLLPISQGPNDYESETLIISKVELKDETHTIQENRLSGIINVNILQDKLVENGLNSQRALYPIVNISIECPRSKQAMEEMGVTLMNKYVIIDHLENNEALFSQHEIDQSIVLETIVSTPVEQTADAYLTGIFLRDHPELVHHKK